MLNDKLFRINFMNQYFSSNSRSGNGKQGQLSPAVTTNREITFNKETVGKSSQKGMLPLQRWKDSDHWASSSLKPPFLARLFVGRD